ncbi:transcriptional repressor [bacterium]|nr:transcriptional repressor [bacterium]
MEYWNSISESCRYIFWRKCGLVLDTNEFLFRIHLNMTSIEAAIRKCREQGMRITPQRILILRELLGNRSHPTVEDIYRAVCREYPNISLATVYNTLNMLVEIGEVRDFSNSNGSRRFDPNLYPHDHAICEACGRLFDVAQHDPEKESILAMGKSFKVIRKQTLYYGRCWICSTMVNVNLQLDEFGNASKHKDTDQAMQDKQGKASLKIKKEKKIAHVR